MEIWEECKICKGHQLSLGLEGLSCPICGQRTNVENYPQNANCWFVVS